MYQKFHALYSWDLYAAHSLLFGTSSDDNFQDFRAWIISCGKKYYQAALSDPELLSGLLDQGEYPVFEGFQKAGWRTFTILDITRNDLNPQGKIHRHQTLGKPRIWYSRI